MDFVDVGEAVMKRICVYCGSKAGKQPEYIASARALGRLLAAQGIGLVYGGASVGIMGEVATSALEAGGHVTGIMPKILVEKEITHPDLSQLIVVDSMHERKAKMEALSDGFIALPGGLGTLEELFEMLTWVQIGYHNKPCAVLNVAGYYDKLLAFLDHAVDEGFLWPEQRKALLVANSAAEVLQQMAISSQA